MYIVLSLGGSLVNTEQGIDKEYLAKIKEIVLKNSNNFGIVVGGGFEARKNAKALREKHASEFECDEAAIKITWKNATLLIRTLGTIAYPKVIKDFKKARKLATKHKIVVMGGTIPGITTDTDSVLLAEALKAQRLVNISNIDAIYDTNPKEKQNAKKYSNLTYEELVELAIKSDKRTAGTNFIFDLLACKLLARSKIEAHFVSGRNIKDIETAIEGKRHSGTIVK